MNLVSQIKSTEIVFVLRESVEIFSNISVLKKLQKRLKEQKKKAIFICSKKFLRASLVSQGFEVWSRITAKYRAGEMYDIANFLYESPRELSQKASLAVRFNSRPLSRPKNKYKKDKQKGFFKHLSLFNRDILQKKTFLILDKIFFGILGGCLFIGILYWFFSGQTSITLKPKMEVVSVVQNFLVALPEAKIFAEDLRLPIIDGEFWSSGVDAREHIVSSGRKYDVTNARGEVTLFNETRREKFLLPSRLSNKEGIIFRFSQNVLIPPRSDAGPGKVIVRIVADPFDTEGSVVGERGNIAAGTELFFPALSPRAQELYYAKANRGPLVGGSSLTHYFLEEKDESQGIEALKTSYKTKIIEDLKQKVILESKNHKKKLRLLENPKLVFTEVKDYIFPRDLVGTEMQTYEARGEVLVKVIVFDENQLLDFLENQLKKSLDSRKVFLLDDESLFYRLIDDSFLQDRGFIKVSVEVFGVEGLGSDPANLEILNLKQKIKESIVGKSKDEALAIVLNLDEIDEVYSIETRPFWHKKVDSDIDNIKIKIAEIKE